MQNDKKTEIKPKYATRWSKKNINDYKTKVKFGNEDDFPKSTELQQFRYWTEQRMLLRVAYFLLSLMFDLK